MGVSAADDGHIHRHNKQTRSSRRSMTSLNFASQSAHENAIA